MPRHRMRRPAALQGEYRGTFTTALEAGDPWLQDFDGANTRCTWSLARFDLLAREAHQLFLQKIGEAATGEETAAAAAALADQSAAEAPATDAAPVGEEAPSEPQPSGKEGEAGVKEGEEDLGSILNLIEDGLYDARAGLARPFAEISDRIRNMLHTRRVVEFAAGVTPGEEGEREKELRRRLEAVLAAPADSVPLEGLDMLLVLPLAASQLQLLDRRVVAALEREGRTAPTSELCLLLQSYGMNRQRPPPALVDLVLARSREDPQGFSADDTAMVLEAFSRVGSARGWRVAERNLRSILVSLLETGQCGAVAAAELIWAYAARPGSNQRDPPDARVVHWLFECLELGLEHAGYTAAFRAQANGEEQEEDELTDAAYISRLSAEGVSSEEEEDDDEDSVELAVDLGELQWALEQLGCQSSAPRVGCSDASTPSR